MNPNRIPKWLFFWVYGAGMLSFYVANYLPLCVLPPGHDACPSPPPSESNLGLLFVFQILSNAALLLSAAIFLFFVYRIWRAIQDGHARTSPGKAVGFMFIPLFNAYWAFQIFWGFVKDHNRFVERHELESPKLREWPYLVYPILTAIGILVIAPVALYLAPSEPELIRENRLPWLLLPIVPIVRFGFELIV
ncbi:MAG: hypothetical protein JW941_02225, partial [Candidatus Coatesbacteria bacterium]|nr:hypothetical protein [Candidatus Coatesbacteria bacterium]